jgi:hypothetical protein
MWLKRKKTVDELKLELKQKKIGELIESMLESNIDIHYAPVSDEYFMIDKDNQLSICLSSSSIRIANHQYLYEVNFSGNDTFKYMEKAKQKVEEKAKNIKKGLYKNEVELIDRLKGFYIK